MGESASIRRKVFDYSVEICSDLFPADELYPSLYLDSQDGNPDGIIEISEASKINVVNEDLNWFPMLKGRLAFLDHSVVIQIGGYIFRITQSGSRFHLEIPRDFSFPRPPEIPVEIALMMFLRNKSFYPLHASGGHLGVGIIFAGRTGCGKSTLAMGLFKAGGRILSDDRIFISVRNEKVIAYSLDRSIFLRDSSSKLLSEKFLFNPETERRGSTISSMKPELLMFPEFSPVEEPGIAEISPSESAMRLLPLTLPPRRKKDLRWIFALARQCKSYTLSLPKAGQAPEIVQRLLKEVSAKTVHYESV